MSVRLRFSLQRIGPSGRSYNTRFYASWLRLPRDDDGRLIFPKFHRTSVVEKRFEWRKVMGNLDGAAWAILCGHMTYPREAWALRQVWRSNHGSWEQDDVKQTLGPKYAAYLVQRALEPILPGMRRPAIFNPVGSVPKKGPDKYRAISDAREAILGVGNWGVRLFTVEDIIDMLNWCSVVFGEDLGDAYHVSLFAGCTGELVWGWCVTGVEDFIDEDGERGQRFTWVIGCTWDAGVATAWERARSRCLG